MDRGKLFTEAAATWRIYSNKTGEDINDGMA